MPRGTRPKTDIAARRREVGRLYLQGKTQPEIAVELAISQPTISRDLKALRDEWLQSALVDLNEAKSKELAKVDALELEYWDGWRRSCEDAETVKQKGKAAGEGGKPQVTDVEKTAKGQAGDPRFLQGIQWCINKRCEILGIDAPKRTDITSDGKSIVVRLVNDG